MKSSFFVVAALSLCVSMASYAAGTRTYSYRCDQKLPIKVTTSVDTVSGWSEWAGNSVALSVAGKAPQKLIKDADPAADGTYANGKYKIYVFKGTVTLSEMKDGQSVKDYDCSN